MRASLARPRHEPRVRVRILRRRGVRAARRGIHRRHAGCADEHPRSFRRMQWSLSGRDTCWDSCISSDKEASAPPCAPPSPHRARRRARIAHSIRMRRGPARQNAGKNQADPRRPSWRRAYLPRPHLQASGAHSRRVPAERPRNRSHGAHRAREDRGAHRRRAGDLREHRCAMHSKRIYAKLDVHKKQELIDLVDSFAPVASDDTSSQRR